MASYLRPRRGKKATATSQLTASAPLKRGEVFFEVPDTGVGTGAGKIKMGDGTTAYASLPYFLEQPTVDYTNAVVAWTNTTAADSDPYSTNATYAGNIIPSASLKTIFTNLKKLLLNYNSQLTTLNNDLAPEYYALQNMIAKRDGTVELKRQGLTVTLTFDSLKLSKTISSRTTLGYVPSALKPKFDTKVLAHHTVDSKGKPCLVGVTTDGEVYVNPFDWSGSNVSTLLYLSLVLTWEV